MPDSITVIGTIATPPKFQTVGNGLPRLSFRLASTQRRFNRDASGWENGDTNWYSVVAFRRLAEHGDRSLSKGDRIVVSGRLKVEDWERDGKVGTNVEIVADAMGPDLMFGTTTFTRAQPATAERPADNAQTVGSGAGVGTASNPLTEPAVDSEGWALPGGAADGGQVTAAVRADDVEPAASAPVLEFAGAEPPF